MPWFALVTPDSPHALALLDIALHVTHSALLVFILAGWAVRRWRRMHLAAVTVVWLSWIGLGLYVGNLGYCPLTDWHWQVKTALGETALPSSYPQYIFQATVGYPIPDSVMAWLAALALTSATLLGSALTIKQRKRG